MSRPGLTGLAGLGLGYQPTSLLRINYCMEYEVAFNWEDEIILKKIYIYMYRKFVVTELQD